MVVAVGELIKTEIKKGIVMDNTLEFFVPSSAAELIAGRT